MCGWCVRVILFVAICGWALEVAQAQDSVGQSGVIDSTEAEQCLDCDVTDRGIITAPENGEDNVLIPLSEKYDGYPMELKGLRKTPVLIHGGAELRGGGEGLLGSMRGGGSVNRWYPELSVSMLGALDLSVDDEVTKAGIAVFQPISTIQDSFAKSIEERDRHLNLFKTQRGIAILTLSYLDKTIAAGLATAQQQVDNDTTHQLLKQIGYNTKKLANPEEWRLYDDVDEKFAFCMAEGTPRGVADAAPRFDLGLCDQKCIPKTHPTIKIDSKYHYCVCCAEQVEKPNTAVAARAAFDGINLGALSRRPWSLVEHLFVGLKIPEVNRLNPTYRNLLTMQAAHIQDVGATIRAIYGDIISYQHSGTGKVVIKYAPPILSVQDWIGLFRDVKQWQDNNPSKRRWASASCDRWRPDGAEEDLIYCGFNTSAIKAGICPSIRKLVRFLDDGSQLPEDDVAWVEASLGGAIAASDIQAMFYSFPDDGQIERYLDTFCDAAAANAFKRMHLRMMSIIQDHLALNRAASRQEKDDFLELVNRVSILLGIGAQDSESYTDALIAGVNTVRERNDMGLRSSTQQSVTNQVQNGARSIYRPFGR